MEISLTEEWLKQLYGVLVNFYRRSEDPVKSAYPFPDFNDAMLNVCVKRPQTKVFGHVIYPHPLQRAAVIMHSIVNFHPFVDGNKRMALLATYYYLIWNGYTFNIPRDADDFTIMVAKDKLGLNEVLQWLVKNTSRSWSNVVRQWMCRLSVGKDGAVPTSDIFAGEATIIIFMPLTGFAFFRWKLEEHKRRKAQGSTVEKAIHKV